ncbi:uncharacterized protein [Euwallacea fornicatus]|uniref:uncharacterized protein isoform X2 n=1 Tax=Euwallacea fornicatus TaxID=995702 RepID=UPI003390554C
MHNSKRLVAICCSLNDNNMIFSSVQYYERSIMSGDSPMHNNRTADAFDFASPNQPVRPQLLDPKSLSNAEPVATTSKDAAVQSGPPDEKGAKGEVQASVLVEPGGKDENGDFGSSTWLNGCDNTVEGENNVERRNNKDNDGDYHGKDKKDKFRKNGNIDRLDGVWVPKEEKQKEEQEDNCIVKCLYVTMTCCECSIM